MQRFTSYYFVSKLIVVIHQGCYDLFEGVSTILVESSEGDDCRFSSKYAEALIRLAGGTVPQTLSLSSDQYRSNIAISNNDDGYESTCEEVFRNKSITAPELVIAIDLRHSPSLSRLKYVLHICTLFLH